MAPTFDQATNEYQVAISGVGFTGDTTSVQLEISGVAQKVISVSTTKAVFGITDITSGAQTTSMFMYFPEGVPKGHTIVQAGIALEPKLS